MKHITFLFFLFFPYFLFSQNIISAKAQALGGQTVFLKNENAFFANPAGFSNMEKWAALAIYERRFLVTDLDFMGVAAALPTTAGGFGFSIQRFGMDEFKENRVGINYGRKLAEKLSVGGSFNYIQTRIEEYGNAGSVGFALGMQADISDELILGAHVINPISFENAFGENSESAFRLGGAYVPSEKILVGFELEKDVDFPLKVKAGFEYEAVSLLQIRGGFSSNPGQFHFGFGIKIKDSFRVDTALRYHQVLGFTPTVGFAL